mmetsp:Transcript_59741/g.118381  ORF Transcript_59741/g.118381 Transcript_59741/m.118381 type:complete len:82 (+) Transcript_59741:277-522(+)
MLQQYQQKMMSIMQSPLGMVACASARATCDCTRQLIVAAMSIACRCHWLAQAKQPRWLARDLDVTAVETFAFAVLHHVCQR